MSVLLDKKMVGVRIRRARKEAGLLQRELAEQVGLVQPQQVSNWERGKSEPPSDRLRRIAEVTGKQLPWFFHGEEEEASRVVPFPGQDHQPARPEQVEALHSLVQEQMNLVKTMPGHLENIDDQLEAITATLTSIGERLDGLDAQLTHLSARAPGKSKSQQQESSS